MRSSVRSILPFMAIMLLVLSSICQAASITGTLNDRLKTPVSGALIEIDGAPAFSTLSNADGSFTISGIPLTPFRLKISKNGYLPVYTSNFLATEDLTISTYPYSLLTPAELPLLPGQGAVIVTVVDSISGLPLSNVRASKNNPMTQIMYLDASSGNFLAAEATDASGTFIAFIPANHAVELSANKYGYDINSYNATVPDGSVLETGLTLSHRPTHSLALQKSGSGNGSISSSSEDTCTQFPCIFSIIANSTAVITAVPSANSRFIGWVGSNCSGQENPCYIFMDSDKTASASFSLQPFTIEGTSRYFPSLVEAFSAVQQNEVILTQKSFASTGTSFNRPEITAVLRGGLDDGFNVTNRTSADYSTINAPLTISLGTLIFDQIIIN